MQLLKQSSTAKALIFKMYDSADHVSGKTGLSPTVTISKNGGSFASPSGSVTEIANGYYKIAGNATDTNTLGSLALYATATGSDPADMAFCVVAFDPDTATNLGLSGLPTANPGAANGIVIAGSNADTTFATLTVSGTTVLTGNVSMAAGLTITQSTTNGHALSLTANGGGSGLRAVGGTTGKGMFLTGGSSSGEGLSINTSAADGVRVAALGGHGFNITCSGASKHGIFATGGNSGTSDGINAVAGTGGVDIRGNITGNITGNVVGTLSTLTTYTGNTPQSGDSFARIGNTGSGLTSLAPSNTAISSAVWTNGIAALLDAPISSRLSAGSYAAPDNAGIAGIKTKTDLLSFTGAGGMLKSESTNAALASVWTSGSLTSILAALLKIQAASYDSASVVGDVITLSNGATQTVTAGGRVTAP